MKRWIFGFFGFPIALFISLFAFHILTAQEDHIEVFAFRVPTLNTPATLLPSENAPSEVIRKPDFHNLPNIDDVDPSKLPLRIVDVKEYGAGSESNTEYRKSEIIAKNNEQWLGLFEERDGLRLRNIKVGVKLHHRAVDPDSEDFYTFSSGWKKAPIFLVKDSLNLKPSSVTTVFQKGDSITKELKVGYVEKFSLLDSEYVLRVVPGATLDGTPVNALVMEAGGTSQVVTYNLYYHDSTTLYDSIGELLFVGDLDGDRKLDFYISDFGFEKGGFGSQLFLSSETKKGQLIQLAAAFGTSGC